MSAALELQEMMVLRLKAEVAVPVYDAVPKAAVMPYLSVGPITVTQDNVGCIDGAEIAFQWDVWSPSSVECMEIAETVRRALHDYEATLSDNALVLLEHERTTRLRDPNGLTFHAAVQFLALVEQP